jgi:hypothetical protein
MTSSPATLAAAHASAHSAIPSPLTIVLAVAAVGYVLWSRMKGQPLKAKRLLVLPVVLTVLGITDLTGSSAPHLTPKDIGFLAAGASISAALGAARGATIELYPQGGELWQRYRPVTVGLWITLIAAKLILMVIAGAAHASAGRSQTGAPSPIPTSSTPGGCLCCHPARPRRLGTPARPHRRLSLHGWCSIRRPVATSPTPARPPGRTRPRRGRVSTASSLAMTCGPSLPGCWATANAGTRSSTLTRANRSPAAAP